MNDCTGPRGTGLAAAARAAVERSRRAQGLPAVVEDAATLDRVAALIAPHPAAPAHADPTPARRTDAA